MHGYGDVFTDDALARNAGIMRLQPQWDVSVETLDVDLALVDSDSALAYALDRARWSTVERDEDFAVLRPPSNGQSTVPQ